MIRTLQERAKTLVELVDAAVYYLTDDFPHDPKAANKFLTADVAGPLSALIDKLAGLEDFSEAAIEQAFAEVLQQTGLPMGKLAQPVRVALTGSTVSPGIHDVIAVLGKERTLQRLRKALDQLR
jgi:glutamyl-tRNA synthetase